MTAGSQVLHDVEILVVDDHQIFAEVLAMRLESELRPRRVAVAGSLSVARSRVRSLAGGVVLLDYHLGDECGLDLLDTLRTLDPSPTVVVLSGSRDPDEIIRALRAGVDAWILKAEGYDTLVEVTVDARNQVMTLPRLSLRDVVHRFLVSEETRSAAPSFLDRLSPRELDVLRLLVAGVPREEIARRLVISPHTVRTHVQHLHQRAEVSSTVALVARAREAGLEV